MTNELLKKIDELEKNLAGAEQAVQESIEINEELKAENKRLQEQLNEANEILSIYRCYDDTECGRATEYCKKWGVK